MSIKAGKQSGFTLIELIISLAILGIVVTPLAGFFTHTIKINTMSKDKMAATQLAQEQIENVKNAQIYLSDGNMPAYMNDSGVLTEYPKAEAAPGGKYAVKTEVFIYGAAAYTINPGSEDSYDVYCNIARQTESGTYSMTMVTGTGTTSVLSGIPAGPASSYIKLDITGSSSGRYTICITHDSLAYTAELSVESTIKAKELKVRVQWDAETTGMSILAQNRSLSETAFYLVKAKDSAQGVNVVNLLGSIKTYNNIYDSSVNYYDKNRLYKIIVSVSAGPVYNDSKRLIQLQALRGGDK